MKMARDGSEETVPAHAGDPCVVTREHRKDACFPAHAGMHRARTPP
jgi:hypothetical protein